MPQDDALVWFRRDLRLADHTALARALAEARRVHCCFVFDSDILEKLTDRTDRRVDFILRSVGPLHDALRDAGGGLHVLHGSARRLVPELAARLGVGAVHANRDYEPFARERDAAVATALLTDGRSLTLHKDQLIFEADELMTVSGRPYRVFTPYRRAWLARLDEELPQFRPQPEPRARLALGPAAEPPGLEALGFRPTDLDSLGVEPGEAGGRAAWLAFQDRLDDYQRLRDYPAAEGTSRLSVHLRFGTLSIRDLVRHTREHTGEGARAWLNELIWREFYQMLLWHFPHTAEHAFQARFDTIAWPDPPGHFEAWRQARTGYPIIDAAMRQLDATGYMHNRLRMLAASFLVKDLHVDWRLGERHFADRLLDYDQAANLGGWQWSASVGTDAQPWFRIFNPVTQSRRFDPEGRFIRRWLPEMAAVPDRYLHAPWRMPEQAQAACGVAVGRDYPPPIVDHALARQATLAFFRDVAHA